MSVFHRHGAIPLLGLVWLLAAPALGAAPGGGGTSSGTHFVCDSVERSCRCTSYSDCERMQEKICGKRQMTCSDTVCTCKWEPTKTPEGRARPRIDRDATGGGQIR